MRRLFPIALFAVLAVLAVPCALAQQDHSESSRKVVSKPEPAYPSLARRMGISGTVRIEALVAPNGSVKSTSIIGGHPVLAQSAQDAVRKCKWEPASHETKEIVILNFHPD
jgi:TonB family protein